VKSPCLQQGSTWGTRLGKFFRRVLESVARLASGLHLLLRGMGVRPQYPSEGPQWYGQPTSPERSAETKMRRFRTLRRGRLCCRFRPRIVLDFSWRPPRPRGVIVVSSRISIPLTSTHQSNKRMVQWALFWLLVEPDVLHAPAVEDAVDHQPKASPSIIFP
jgi:hypothetical protein